MGDVILVWDFTINSNCSIQINRVDIVIKGFKKYKCLTDMIIASEKSFKQKNLIISVNIKIWKSKLQECGKLRTNYYSSCSRIAGMIKNTDTYIKKFPGNPSLSKIQKIMLMSTA